MNYRRRRCALETCDQLFTPARKNQRFCSTEHKYEFHFKTPTFRKTEREIVKLVAKELAKAVPKIERGIWLRLETNPPPALIDRIIRIGELAFEKRAKSQNGFAETGNGAV
jgi:hypothetical protein